QRTAGAEHVGATTRIERDLLDVAATWKHVVDAFAAAGEQPQQWPIGTDPDLASVRAPARCQGGHRGAVQAVDGRLLPVVCLFLQQALVRTDPDRRRPVS